MDYVEPNHMANQYIAINPFNPDISSQAQRAVMGVLKSGPVTYDTDYGDGIYARWIYVGAAGNVAYRQWDGTTSIMYGANAGVWYPACSLQILGAGSGTTVAANRLLWGY